jgi:hypothetical protein
MTKSLQTADHILKLLLASGVILCYAFGVIAGSVATLLFILAVTVIISFAVQVVIVKFRKD